MYRIISKSSILAIVLTLVLNLSGCTASGSASIITPNGAIITIEVANTPKEQEQGLMFRKTLAVNSGMLFIFEQEQFLSFWMKNTLIPLDVLYLDPKAVIVDIQTMPPCSPEEEQCPSYTARGRAIYALEINAGEAEKLGLKIGDQLTLNIPTHDQSPTK